MEALQTQQSWDNSQDGYDDLKGMVSNHRKAGQPVFMTNVDGVRLWEAYLSGIVPEARQHYNCNTCKSFIMKYGGLVTIDEKTNKLEPVFFYSRNNADFFSASLLEMDSIIKSSKIKAIFFDDEKVLGIPSNYSEKHQREFEHFSAPNTFLNSHCIGINFANQQIADSKERFKMLINAARKEYSEETARIASEIVGEFSRGDKTEAWAKWFLSLYSKKHTNQIWLEIAKSTPSWCHVKSSVLGALMDDIQSGMGMEAIKRRFEEKMDPLKYQRPQSAPSDSNIEQAEKIIKELGYEESLKRRYATVDEVEKIWSPVVDAELSDDGSVFGHLKKSAKKKVVEMPSVKSITFEKFKNEIMPTAEKMWLKPNYKDAFGSITAAVNSDAPNIMKWKNSYAWFIRCVSNMWGGREDPLSSDWGCSGLTEVKAVSYVPSMWENAGHVYNYKSAIFILDGCQDKNGTVGNALFPEILTGELHSVRKTIEAFSKSQSLETPAGDLACGVIVSGGMVGDSYIVVESNSVKKKYKIDRWS